MAADIQPATGNARIFNPVLTGWSRGFSRLNEPHSRLKPGLRYTKPVTVI